MTTLPFLLSKKTTFINFILVKFEYPQVYKKEICTPVPKIFPPEKIKQMRNISGLFNFDKVMEKLITGLMIIDMEQKSDPSQFGNEKGTSVDHYLVK